MIRPIEYLDYDKISDDILYLGSKLYLRINVSLSKKDGNFRYHFHKEFNYGSTYSGDDNGLVSIKRSFNYYITFDKTDDNVSVMIRPQDMIILKKKLNKVSEWFDNGTFGIVEDDIVAVVKKRRPIVVDGLPAHMYLQFDPIVINYEESNTQIQGVQIILGDPLITASITVDNFFGLLYTIEQFNMFESAQNMLNYLGRPEFGTNLLEMNRNTYPTNLSTNTSTTSSKKKKKKNEPEKNSSFFQ